MKASDFDELFDSGQDIIAHLDLSSTRRPGLELRRVSVSLPAWIVTALDREARRLGVVREDLIKVWLAEKLKQRN